MSICIKSPLFLLLYFSYVAREPPLNSRLATSPRDPSNSANMHFTQLSFIHATTSLTKCMQLTLLTLDVYTWRRIYIYAHPHSYCCMHGLCLIIST
jgi:hypothetical protein